MRSSRAYAAVFILLICLPAASAGTSAPVLEQRLQQKLDQLREEAGIPGACMGYALHDGVSGSVCSGLADVESQEKLATSHRLMAGSVGKMFVAAVILNAVQQGTLELDAPLSGYLGREPWFPRVPNAPELTLRMLLNHTSGIPEHVLAPEFVQALRADPGKEWKPEELMAFVLDEPGLFPAGESWSYADTNFILAGIVYEHATGKRLLTSIEDEILRRFSLQDTLPADRRSLPRLANGYSRAGSPFQHEGPVLQRGVMFINPQMEWAGGGFASNAHDLVRWARLLFAGDVVGANATDAMLNDVETHGRGGGPGVTYGLGVMMRPSPWGPTYGHSGWFPGYLTELSYFPSRKTAIAVQMNSDAAGKSLRPMLHALAEVVLADPGATEPAPVSSAADTPPAELIQTAQSILTAISKTDKAALRNLLADEALFTSERARTFTRDELLEALQPLGPGYEWNLKVEKPRSVRFGDTAVLTYDVVEDMVIFGHKHNALFHATDTYILRDGRWQMLAAQLVPVYRDPKPVQVSEAALERVAGTYELSKDVLYVVRREGARLFGARTGRPEEELFPESDQVFFRKGARARKVFVSAADGTVSEMLDRQDGNDLHWRRVPAGQPDSSGAQAGSAIQRDQLMIPRGAPAVIDGRVSDGEWDQAVRLSISTGDGLPVPVRLFHDSQSLFALFTGLSGRAAASLLFPEILVRPEVGNSEAWQPEDAWFHASARDCHSKGKPNDYSTCVADAPTWEANNFTSMERPPQAIEMRIPLKVLGILPGKPFRIAVNATDTRRVWYFWPASAVMEKPGSWMPAGLE